MRLRGEFALPSLTCSLATGVVLHSSELERGEATAWPLAGGAVAAPLTKLPDVLEPAVHPNHRQFFHSVVFAALVAGGWKALYDWQPQSDDARFLRKVGMIGAGAYLCHLALDALTAKSLPLIGR